MDQFEFKFWIFLGIFVERAQLWAFFVNFPQKGAQLLSND
jgi:hypothetical protein